MTSVSRDMSVAQADALRAAIITTFIAAFEQAQQSGLCAEGALEVAVGAVEQLDLAKVLAESIGPASEDTR